MEISKDQAAAMQEKLRNMSPEELKELQKQQCIFCHIISGKVSSKKVYEDEKCIAVLDINPANPGHIVLIPKEHYSIMPQLNEEEIAHLFMIAKHLSHALLKALKAEGTNIFIANGIAAGQRAQHLMIHIIPRMENDSLEMSIPKQKMKEEDLNRLKAMLVNAIKERIGSEIKESPEKKEEQAQQAVEIIKPRQIKPIIEERKMDSGMIPEQPKIYVKSESSDKFHNPVCPFARRIKKKIFLTKQQAYKFKPCECVIEEPAVYDKFEAKKRNKHKSDLKETARMPKKKKDAKIKKEQILMEKKQADLDDIAELLGAR